jgi:hypothetical protein
VSYFTFLLGKISITYVAAENEDFEILVIKDRIQEQAVQLIASNSACL